MNIVEAGASQDAGDAASRLVGPETDELTPELILANLSSPSLAIAHLKLSCPELVNYQGGWFLASHFTEAVADGWFAAENATVSAVEAVMNHIHIQQDVFGACNADAPDMTNEEAFAVGQILSYQWKRWARDVYQLEIAVFLSQADGDYSDVQIWFESRRRLS